MTDEEIIELEAVITSHGIPVKTYSGGVAHYVSGEEWNCQSALEQLRAELAACQKDAERYRWLRDTQEGKTVRIMDRREWDFAIDEALAKLGADKTGEGYAVESEVHYGSVQIYPAKALEKVDE